MPEEEGQELNEIEEGQEEEGQEEGEGEGTGEETGEEGEGQEQGEEGEEKGEEGEGEEGEEGEETGEEAEIDDEVYAQVKKAAPDLFKKVPELKRVIFREQEFTKHFTSPKEAEEAARALETFEQINNEIISGNAEDFVEALSNVGRDSLHTFLGNLMPALEKHDKNLPLELTFPVIKKILKTAAAHSDKRISLAAQNIHYFVFGDMDFEKQAGLTPKTKSESEDRVSKREQDWERRQLNTFASDVASIAEKRAKFHIAKPLEDADISELSRRHLTDEIYSRVDRIIQKDVRFQGNNRHLWELARRSGFTSDRKDSIVSAYLSRAKLLIPKIRQQVLAEAKVKIVKGERELGGSNKKKRIPSTEGTRTTGSGKSIVDKRKEIDWSKTSERGLLDGKVAYKQ